MNSIDLQSFLSQRCDIIRSFYSECEKDQNMSTEIDMKLLKEAISRTNILIENYFAVLQALCRKNRYLCES